MEAVGMQALWVKIPLAEAVIQVFRFVGDDTRLQAIFDKERGRCYDDVIRFPNLVTLIADALLEHGGSGNQSFSRAREAGELIASKVAAYGKLGRLPISLSQTFLADLTHSLRELFPVKARRKAPFSLCRFSTITRFRGMGMGARLDCLLSSQWSNRWIKAVNKKRRVHVPKPHDRNHGSVYRLMQSAVRNADT